jgi:hypothetical protein
METSNLLPIIGFSSILVLIIFVILNKLLWAWYLDLSDFKEQNHKTFLEMKKQTELLKLLCDQKGLDTSSINVIESEKRKKGNLFVKE